QRLAVRPGDLEDPDSNLTGTVYTKGAGMLQWLEQQYGRETFDAFLRGYFDHFAFQPITTEMFLAYANEHLLAANPGKASQAALGEWVCGPGIPDSAPATDSARCDAVDAARSAWLEDGTLPAADATDAWSTQEWVHFIEGMPE